MNNQNNLNLNENTMNNIKNLVDNGNISDAISQISPEMIQQFSSLLSNSNNQNNTNNINNSTQNNTQNNIQNNNPSTSSNTNTSNENTNSQFGGLDIGTIMKMSSAFGKMNNTNDPRANLLNSLKPYLRDTKKDKLDNYVNLLNMTKIADILKNNPNLTSNKEKQ